MKAKEIHKFIEDLDLDPEEEVFIDVWTYDDIQDYEYDLNCSISQDLFPDVIKNIEHHYDSEKGVNNNFVIEMIQETVDEHREQEERLDALNKGIEYEIGNLSTR